MFPLRIGVWFGAESGVGRDKLQNRVIEEVFLHTHYTDVAGAIKYWLRAMAERELESNLI